MIYENYISKLNAPQSYEFKKYYVYKHDRLVFEGSLDELNKFAVESEIKVRLSPSIQCLEFAGYVVNQVFDQVAYLKALNQYEEEYESIQLQFKNELINSYISGASSLQNIIDRNNKLSDFFDECAKNDASFFEIEELFTRFIRFI